MQALTYHGNHDVRLERVPDPVLRADTDALVRVSHAAICGSDLHLWEGPTPPAERAGFALGHEFIGVVEDVGSAVQRFRRGDRVLVACTTGCGACEACGDALHSACPITTAGGTAQNVFGFSHELPGGQAEAARVPFADVNLVAAPQSLSDEAALLLTDILPTAYLGTELAAVRPGDVVVVLGCGPVGRLAQVCAQLRGAACVIAVDRDADRLAAAAAQGCVAVDAAGDELDEVVRSLTAGRGADATIEAVGRPELVRRAIEITRAGGHVAVIGVVFQSFELPWLTAFRKNLSIRTGLVSPQRFAPALVRLLEQGRIDPTAIFSHRVPLRDGPDAYAMFAERKDRVLKVMLLP